MATTPAARHSAANSAPDHPAGAAASCATRRGASAGRGVPAEDRQPPPAVRHRHGDVGIEAARPPDGRVDGGQPVGRRQHDHLSPRVEAVEQQEQLGDQLCLMVLSQRVAPAGERVQFIDENDRGLVRAGPREDLPEVGLTLPHPPGRGSPAR